MKLQILTWTPSRYAKWKECPAKVKYEDLLKTCPKCFKGRVSGGFDGEPVVCDTCDEAQPERAALDRGNRLDAALTLHVQGLAPVKKPESDVEMKRAEIIIQAHTEALSESLRHPEIERLVKSLKRLKGVQTQVSYVIDNAWNQVSQYTKNAWGRLKLDVLRFSGRGAEVIDWKSGNIDKSKGLIRERDEYHDSMRAYQLVVLAVNPKIQRCDATMAFLDAPPKLDNPFKSLKVLERKDLAEAKEAWEKKISPMLHDTIFAPRPGYYCSWCPFSGKLKRGAPCPH